MKKKISIILFLITISFIGITEVFALNGSHSRKDLVDGECSWCHVPHSAKGARLWARSLSDEFLGVRQLCDNCHDGTYANQGIDTIFVYDGDAAEDHVMHGGAICIKDLTDCLIADIASITDTCVGQVFPLDPNDEDTVPQGAALEEYRKGGDGFYCGSCHDVHNTPKESGGNYLRYKRDASGNPIYSTAGKSDGNYEDPGYT